MPFSITCPSCDSRLTVPDALAGKRVKCKKCDEPFVARRPGGDDEDEDEAPPARSKVSKPAAKSRREEDDEDEPPRKASRRPADDDEEDEDEAPRKKPAKAARRAADDEDDDDEKPARKRGDDDEDDDGEPRPKARKGKKGKKGKKKAGSPVLLFVLLGVGVLLLLGGGGVGVYYAFFAEEKKTDTPVAKGGPGPGSIPAPGPAAGGALAGWVDFSEAAGRYKVKVPRQPGPAITQRQPLPTGDTLEVVMHAVDLGQEVFISGHVSIPAAAQGQPDALLDQSVSGAAGQAKGAVVKSRTPITYQGFPGRQAVIEYPGKKGAMILRVILANDRMIMLLAGGDAASADAPRVKGFFESLKIE